MSEKQGVIWQLKEGLKSKRLLVRVYNDDMQRAIKLREAAQADVEDYEQTLRKLGEEVAQ